MSKYTGWICPKCGRVWSPSTASCRECGPGDSGSPFTAEPTTAGTNAWPPVAPPVRYPFPGGTVTVKTPDATTATVTMGRTSVDLPTEQAMSFVTGTDIEPSLHPLN